MTESPQLKPEEMGQMTPDQMRADPGAGRGDTEPTEMTTFDGAGNPIKHVITDDDSGRMTEGTGPDTESAMSDAKDPSHVLGDDVTPSMESEGDGSGEPVG
ncbi:MAG: hypothetical protein KY450_09650 [Actinobacteria bacterium]|nr:hypothetical protein [Actinomycetota bacterium]